MPSFLVGGHAWSSFLVSNESSVCRGVFQYRTSDKYSLARTVSARFFALTAVAICGWSDLSHGLCVPVEKLNTKWGHWPCLHLNMQPSVLAKLNGSTCGLDLKVPLLFKKKKPQNKTVSVSHFLYLIMHIIFNSSSAFLLIRATVTKQQHVILWPAQAIFCWPANEAAGIFFYHWCIFFVISPIIGVFCPADRLKPNGLL